METVKVNVYLTNKEQFTKYYCKWFFTNNYLDYEINNSFEHLLLTFSFNSMSDAEDFLDEFHTVCQDEYTEIVEHDKF